MDGTELTDKRSVAEIKWTDWHTHRIDWVAGKSSWYIDGVHQLDKTYGVPTVPSYVVFNMWSDGGVWSGNMSVNCQALLEIEWVEMVFNVSGPVDSSDYDSNSRKPKVRRQNTGCITPCSVDENGESRILTGGYTTTSAGTRNSTMWTGTSDREFVIATAMGAAVAVVLYMIDMSTM